MKRNGWILVLIALGIAVWGIVATLPGLRGEAAPTTAETPQTRQEPAEAGDDVNGPFVTPLELRDESPPTGAAREFSTDFSIHSVSYNEILSGGPPKDGIPAINNPRFVSIAEADSWLRPLEPVVLLEINGEAKAYPIQILTWHEIVNDVLGGEPVTVTFCPLCNTAIAFERTVNGEVFDFGTSGRLRLSNLIMYDRQTETWWQQASGNAIAGKLTGTQLGFLPAQLVSWEDFKANFPDAMVLSKETGFSRSYGNNPYAGYDDINSSPFLFSGPTDGKLPAMTRVLTVDLDGEAVAYTFDQLAAEWVLNDTVAGQPVVVIWELGTESAFQSGFPGGYEDVGTAASFSAVVDGETLTFRVDGAKVIDENTGSSWNILGEAVDGPLAGTRLEPIVSVNHFWFSWAAFRPETRIYGVGE